MPDTTRRTAPDSLTPADRATLISDLETCRSGSDEGRAAAEDIRKAEAEIERLEPMVAAAKARRAEAQQRRTALGGSNARRAEAIATQLRRDPYPCVRELAEWAKEQLEAFQASTTHFQRDASQRTVEQKHSPVVASDKASRDRRFEYLRQVLRHGSGLVQQAAEIADEADAAAFCSKVKKGLPPLKMEPIR